MVRINLAPTGKKGRAPKAKGPKAAPSGIKLPSIQATILYVIGTVIVVVIIALIFLFQSSKISGLNSDIKQLSIKLEELKVYKAAVDSLEKRELELGRLIKPISELNKNRFFIAHVLDEVANRIPEFTWLTSLEIGQSNLKLIGVSASNLLVADMMNRLEESPYISNVDLTVLEKKVVEKQEMMNFSLTANVGYEASKGGAK